MKRTVGKIMFIDDDDTFSFIIKKTFEIGGIKSELICKTRAEEALSELSKMDNEAFPQLIFLDINMPVMDGFEFLEAYKNLGLSKAHNDTVIAMLSSSIYINDEKKAKVFEEVQDFITKPIDLEGIHNFCLKHELELI